MPKPSPDEMIKNLLRDYPADALEFFKPEIIERYGPPGKVHFHIQEIKKHSHYDRNMKNDIAITYTFAGGKKVVLVLIEHWSDKAKFDIHRFAHYLIDLSYRFPGMEILPVALFTDRAEKWLKRPPSEIRVSCLDETYLLFRYNLIRMKDHQAEKYRKTKNRFIAVLRSAMKYEIEKKIALAVELIQNYGYIENDIRTIEKNLAVFELFLEIDGVEMEHVIESIEGRREAHMSLIVKELKKRGYLEGKRQGIHDGLQQGLQQGMREGILDGKRETARAMKQEGIDIELISRVTGLPVEEIRVM